MTTELKFNERKATEAASMLLKLKGGRSDYWWIIKMLYLVDREAFQEWERPITNDLYESWKYGPVPKSIYNIINKNNQSPFWKTYIVTLSKNSEVMLTGSPAPIKKLSKAETDLIKSVFDKFGQLDGKQLVEYTHTLPEWKDPKKVGSITPIETADLLSVLDYSSDDIERISLEIEDEEELNRILGD